MTRTRRLTAILAFALLLTPASTLLADDPALSLEIGDPARRHKKAPLVWDAITDTRTGDLLSPAALAPQLADKRLVLVGETHTDINFHLAQLRIIQELHAAGRKVLIGLEMFPYPKQEFLTKWSAGEYSEEEFLVAADWYDTWGTHWDYYRQIFLFARDNRLPMYALNTPREVVAAVRMKGFDELTDEQKEHMPPAVDTDNEEHFRLFKAFFEEEEDEFHAQLTDEQWQGMFNAQCTWDATFGHQALKVLDKHPEPEAVLVVLVGSGHVAYDLGIQRQVRQWSDVGIATVVPIWIREWDEFEPITEVQASYADYLWGMPPATDPIYPTLGVSTTTRDKDHLTVIYVGKDSVGEAAGFELGDELLEMDGTALETQAKLRELIAGKHWGDTSVFKIQRGGEMMEIDVAYRRELPDYEHEDEATEGDAAEGDAEEGGEGEEEEQS